MTEAYSLFSGSSGNSSFIKSGNTSILVDAGKNTKSIVKALTEIGAALEDISAILITHAHSDHVSALPVLLKKYTGKLFCSFDTFHHLTEAGIDGKRIEHFDFGDKLIFDDITVIPYPAPHDISGATCYRFECSDKTNIAVATDIGYVSDEVFSCLFGADAALIESNHDVRMLKNGPYPQYLKERILSECGHLSNESCARVLPRLASAGTKTFVLGHISFENNDCTVARRCAEAALDGMGCTVRVASRTEVVNICKK
ncbi:MAG: MBL fold metallo-hydrolase [Clostridia bacterium]|nr:MBL fold metallo-hydrolase [Clostridia bacterium]MBR0327804.1 MBL fold metallo-hydrolase [Clostridia bacterium]